MHTLAFLLTLASFGIGREDQILVLCNGLNGVVTNVQKGYISVQELIHWLLAHKGRLKQRTSTLALLPSANMASINPNRESNTLNLAQVNTISFLMSNQTMNQPLNQQGNSIISLTNYSPDQ